MTAGDGDLVVRVHIPVRPSGGVSPASAAELAADRLWAEGATAVCVTDDETGTVLVAGYPTGQAARTVAARLATALGAVLDVAPPGAADEWRRFAEPVPIGRGLVVVPSWRQVPIGADRLGIEIDPGRCFGSGTHATTRMLLEWMDGHPPVGAAATDVGTGSGILAVAAARLGATRVTAVDIDPEAVAVVAANAARNGVGDRIEASVTPVAALPAASADLVVVNVTAGVHAEIGSDCGRLLRPGATLLLSGLLPGQWEHVQPAYADLAVTDLLALDGWEGAVLTPASRTG